jgi:hypothetical protein
MAAKPLQGRSAFIPKNLVRKVIRIAPHVQSTIGLRTVGSIMLENGGVAQLVRAAES